MTKQARVGFCHATGVQVQLAWDLAEGRAINRTCSVQIGCSRFLKSAQAPQKPDQLPIAACLLLDTDK